MKRLGLGLVALILSASVAFAGSGTITVLDSTGTTKTYAIGTNGSTNFFGLNAICDGPACANIAAVKAASTAAVATDPSLVVQISPNQPLITITAAQATAANLNATVIGTITANAGTNLNTSLLALESGGNLAAVNAVQGTIADTAWSGTGNSTVVAALKQLVLSYQGATPAGSNAIGSLYNPSTIYSQHQTVTASAVALPSQALVNGITITALSTNTAAICTGPSGVTTGTGYCLNPGQSTSYGVSNLNAVYIIGSNTSDVVQFTGN